MGVHAATEGDHGVVRNQIADSFDHHLGPQRRTRSRFDFPEQAICRLLRRGS
jgi:hypothetical protein